MLKQLHYSLLISMRDSWFELRPDQLSRERNLELEIWMLDKKCEEKEEL